MIDFAGLDAGVVESSAAEVTPEVDAGTSAEIETTGSENGKVADGAEKNADGAAKKDPLEDHKSPTPQSVRTALKQLRDGADALTPEGKAIHEAVKSLHRSFEVQRQLAEDLGTKNVYAAVKTLKAFSDQVGGADGLAALNENVAAIRESDDLLYAGDPKLMDNIIEDLKSEGKLDALGKLAPAFLDKLKEHDAAGYYKSFAPHFLSGLKESGVDRAINAVWSKLHDGDTEGAKAAVKAMGSWYSDLAKNAQQIKNAPLDEERKSLEKEKQEFAEGKVKERNTEIASGAEKSNNELLGGELKSYLKMPFFKGFTKANLIPLGNMIKGNLHADLKADKHYQAQIKSLFAAKTPDKEKIREFHRAAVQNRASRIVRDTIQTLYPGYAKGGSAAGRVAAATAKADATKKTDAAAAASGKPVYVPQKPKWDALDHDKDPKDLLFISGRGYLRGSGRFITWRKA